MKQYLNDLDNLLSDVRKVDFDHRLNANYPFKDRLFEVDKAINKCRNILSRIDRK